MTAPVLISQRTSPDVLGWSGRRYIAFLRRKNVRHVRDGRLFVARVSDVLAALGLAADAQQPAVPTWNREDVVAQLMGAK